MSELIPPDYERCQAEHRPAHSPFMLGPPRRMRRCEAKPDFVAVEVVPGSDGLHGSMTLCLACAEVMLKDADLRARVQLQPIINEQANSHGAGVSG